MYKFRTEFYEQKPGVFIIPPGDGAFKDEQDPEAHKIMKLYLIEHPLFVHFRSTPIPNDYYGVSYLTQLRLYLNSTFYWKFTTLLS